MSWFPNIGDIIGSRITISVVIGALSVWALWSGFYLYRQTQRLIASLTQGAGIVATANDPLDFAARYEALARQLASVAPLRTRWREFAASLVVPTKSGRPIRSSMRPTVWFDLQLLRSRQVGFHARYHAALPNLLVGAGLLFTFLGLAVALGNAGDIVGDSQTPKSAQAAMARATSLAGDIIGDAQNQRLSEGTAASNVQATADDGHQGRSRALKNLLDTASFKFLTSLTGLFLSIAYASFRNARLRSVEAAIDRFVDLLEERAPLVTPAALQHEANDLIERQLGFAESFANDLSLTMQNALDQAFDQRLGEHIGPLRAAVEALAARLSTSNEDAIGKMLETFLAQLRGGADDKMQSVAATLEGLGARLEGLQTGLGEAAAGMAQSAEAMAQRMGEGAEAALSRVTDQMAGVVEALRGIAEEARKAGADAGADMTREMAAAARNFEAASRGVGESLTRAAERLGENLGSQTTQNAERLNGQIERMVAQLQDLAQVSRDAGAQSLNSIADKVGQAAAAFEAMAQKTAQSLNQAAEGAGGALGQGAEQVAQRIAEATEGMRRDMAALVAQLWTSAAEAGETMRAGGAEGAGALKSMLSEAGAAMGATLSAAAREIAEAGAAAGTAMKSGGEAAGGEANRLAGQAQALTRAGEGAAGRVAELAEAARDAAAPLRAASGDLKDANAGLARTAAELAAAASRAGEAASQIGGAMQRLEGTQASARTLADNLVGAVNRFTGLDEELGEVFVQLETGLKSFRAEVEGAVNQTDATLAKAVTQLHRLVVELQELQDK